MTMPFRPSRPFPHMIRHRRGRLPPPRCAASPERSVAWDRAQPPSPRSSSGRRSRDVHREAPRSPGWICATSTACAPCWGCAARAWARTAVRAGITSSSRSGRTARPGGCALVTCGGSSWTPGSSSTSPTGSSPSTDGGERVLRMRAGDREGVDPDADGELLRQPAAPGGRPHWPVGPGRRRRLGVLAGSRRLGSGRADRDPRDEPALSHRRTRSRTAVSASRTTTCASSWTSRPKERRS